MNSFLPRNLLLAASLAMAAPSAMAALKVGDPFPELARFGLEGALPDGLQGKVVIIDFWASWCGPCKESFPAMNELQKQYGDQGVVIIAVNEDEEKGDMQAFLKANPAAFTVVRDARQKLVDLAGIKTMPSSFMVDRAGVVRFAHSGFHGSQTRKAYAQEIESLLTK